MSQQCVFTVYDSTAQAYLQPFFAINEYIAQRMIRDLLSDPEHQFTRHVHDYSLHHIGIWDDLAGTLQPLEEPDVSRLVCKLSELLEPTGE